MNDFSNEINEVFRAAGIQIDESQVYFTDWKSIRDKTIKRYINERLEVTGVLEDDDWFIQKWLEENASTEILEQLYEECGSENIVWVSAYINKNADEGGIVSKVAYDISGNYFDKISKQIQKEFEKNNLIYRMIDSDKSPKEIAQLLKTNGTGNCWAKQEENAKSYYGNGHYNEYCLIGEATMDNVNWESTIFLRMMAEYENEVRLKKDSPIHIIGIKYYHYNDDNSLDKQDHMKVDLNLSVGHTYTFNESIAYASKKDLSDIILKNPTKKELKDNGLNFCRCMEDSEGNWYFADMENMLHSYIESSLRDKAYFPLFNGNDNFGISYYNLENNEFWYNLNDYMFRDECVEQYNKSNYLKTTFPNARIIRNPYGDFEDDFEDDYEDDDYEQLTEEIIHVEPSNYDDYMAVVLENPTRKELRDNKLEHSRFICYEDGTWLFFDSMQWIHDQILSKGYHSGSRSIGMGFYDLRNNDFIFIESFDSEEDTTEFDEEVAYYTEKCKKWLLTKPYIRTNFGLNPNVTIYGDWVDSPW